jgi:prevent-host-death family protein
MARVGVRELKSKLRYYLSLASKGQQVVVTNRGRDVAVITPVEEAAARTRLATMVREGAATWEGSKPGVQKAVMARGKPASSIVIEERR